MCLCPVCRSHLAKILAQFLGKKYNLYASIYSSGENY